MKNILVVDDEEDIRMCIADLLSSTGFHVVLAKNGDECLKELKSKTPDLILLDIMMPDTNIIEVVRQIKKTKIIFLTVVRENEKETSVLKTFKNVVGWINKPFDVNILLKEIKKNV